VNLNQTGFLTALLAATLLVACSTNIPEDKDASVNAGSLPVPEVETEPASLPHPQVGKQENDADDANNLEQIIVTSEMRAYNAVATAKARASGMYNSNMNNTAQPYQERFLPMEPEDRENYQNFDDNPLHLVTEDPVSTFSIDVDTASYANVRRILNQGQLPRNDAVRVEELINYFSYNYPNPDSSDQAFRVHTEMGPSPWNPSRKLVHIGIRGHDVEKAELPPANLVFLIDVSGSMNSANKLELLKPAMKLLTRQLTSRDKISIAVYAGAAGVVLEPTAGNKTATIMHAIDALNAGGSTNGGAGIRLAYNLAKQAFIKEGINRVILATDGDFNVGTTNVESLKNLIEQERNSGVTLTVLGFGGGNYNDALMQELAQNGNGNAAYIDNLNEARKVLVDEMASTLHTIAKDVKIQVEFNPAVVSEYRLIGYETRHLNREDFNNDKVDAGDIGAGHTVTALYEVTLAGDQGQIDPLRYGDKPAKMTIAESRELGFVRLRFKTPNGDTSELREFPLQTEAIVAQLSQTSTNYQFSAAVAGFGQLLRGGRYTGDFNYTDVLDLALKSKGNDPFGYRGEFVNLVRTAQALGVPVEGDS